MLSEERDRTMRLRRQVLSAEWHGIRWRRRSMAGLSLNQRYSGLVSQSQFHTVPDSRDLVVRCRTVDRGKRKL